MFEGIASSLKSEVSVPAWKPELRGRELSALMVIGFVDWSEKREVCCVVGR